MTGERDLHPSHMHLWHVPWYIATKQPYVQTLVNFRRDIVTRLQAALRAKGLLSSVEERDAGILRFFEHWAHILLRESLPLHNHAYEQRRERDPAATMLMQTRRSLRLMLLRDRRMVAESPAHPHWGKRGYLWETKSEHPIWVSEATASAQQFAVKVLGPHPGIDRPERCFASEAAMEAVPELFSCDTSQYIEYSVAARKKIRTLLEGEPTFTPELRMATIDALTDLWNDLNEESSLALASLQKEGDPDVLDGDAEEVFNAYITPVLENMPGSAGELQHYIPLMTYLTFRSLLNKEDDVVAALAIAWNVFAVHCSLPPRVIGPLFLATSLIDSSRAPGDLLNQNVL